MKLLGKTIAASAIAGAALVAAPAMADTSKLTQDEKTAISILKDFNSCVVRVQSNPAWKKSAETYRKAFMQARISHAKAMKKYNAYWTQARDIATKNGDMAKIEAAEKEMQSIQKKAIKALRESKMTPQLNAELRAKFMAARAKLVALDKAAMAKVEAKIGKAPARPVLKVNATKPADPGRVCMGEAQVSMKAKGTDFNKVRQNLASAAKKVGDKKMKELTAPVKVKPATP